MEKKNWREMRDEKVRKTVDKWIPKQGITNAYWRTAMEFGLSVPTVIKIYKAGTATKSETCAAE